MRANRDVDYQVIHIEPDGTERLVGAPLACHHAASERCQQLLDELRTRKAQAIPGADGRVVVVDTQRHTVLHDEAV